MNRLSGNFFRFSSKHSKSFHLSKSQTLNSRKFPNLLNLLPTQHKSSFKSSTPLLFYSNSRSHYSNHFSSQSQSAEKTYYSNHQNTLFWGGLLLSQVKKNKSSLKVMRAILNSVAFSFGCGIKYWPKKLIKMKTNKKSLKKKEIQ